MPNAVLFRQMKAVDCVQEKEGTHPLVQIVAVPAKLLEGFGILPMCSMVRHFVEINPQFIASVPQWARGRMGLPQ